LRKYWKPAEINRLIRLYPNMENGALGKRLGRGWASIQQKAIKLGLRKSAAFMASEVCRFQKGMTPWNLGKTGYMGRNRTSFRKGNKPQTWRPVGSERVTRDGILQRKVRDSGETKRDWKPVKDLLWIAKHGRIPKGWFVVHKDRNRKNFALGNLTLVNRAENMRLNTYHRYPKEIARLIQLRGALNRRINRMANEKQALRS
jgi:hypothetical protein